MMTLRTLEGAEKCAFRLFRLLEDRLVLIFVMLAATRGVVVWYRCSRTLTTLEMLEILVPVPRLGIRLILGICGG